MIKGLSLHVFVTNIQKPKLEKKKKIIERKSSSEKRIVKKKFVGKKLLKKVHGKKELWEK